MFSDLIFSKLYVTMIANVENKKEAKNKLILYYIILTLLCGIAILFFGGEKLSSPKNGFFQNIILSLTYIIGNFPFLLLIIIKYLKMYYLILNKPDQIYKINALNIFKEKYNGSYPLTINKLYIDCQRRMSLIQFIASMMLSISSIGSILISILISDSVSSTQSNNAYNSRTPGYDQFIQTLSNEVFIAVLGILFSILIIILVYYSLNYICVMLIDRYRNIHKQIEN